MTEETVQNEEQEDQNEESSTQTENSEQFPQSWDEVFQHPRFKELNKRAKEAESELGKLQKAREEAERKAAEEQGKFKELYEKAQSQAEEAERERKELELRMLRRDVASEVGIPDALADRLMGETREELEQDAKQLLETLPKSQQQAPPLNGGAGRGSRPGDAPTLTEAQLEVAKKMNLTPEQYRAQLKK